MDQSLPVPQLEPALRAAVLRLLDGKRFRSGLDPVGTDDPARSIEPVKAVRQHQFPRGLRIAL
jgi:hypothetical protein